MTGKYYCINQKELLEIFNSSLDGLKQEEVEIRLKKYGLNELPRKKKDSILKILFKELMDPIVILLIITVIFSLIIGELIDALAILFIIAIDLIMGTFQEWKAEKNAEGLENLIKQKVRVLRSGQEIQIDSKNLVIGDIVLLESGDKVSADLRILECNNLQIDESVLTGESIGVYKTHNILDESTILSERKNMVYAGTSVITGRAKCIVIATSLNTEIGKISHEVINTKGTKSPLTIRMEKFSKQITILIIVVAILISIILFSKGVEGNVIFLSVIALSVSAMPEGLPLALTMALTIASNKMSKKNVIVKKLNSVESLGSCTVIATDKTGTLTVNEQTAKKVLLPNDTEYNIPGIGYKVTKAIDIDEIKSIALLGMINNEALYDDKNCCGDSIDIAFLVLAKKLNINIDDIEILKEIPYESENKYSAVFYKYMDKIYCTAKGSIEKILEFSTNMRMDNVTKINNDKLISQNEKLAKEGYRVIALASGEVENFIEKDIYNSNDIKNLVFEGLVGFIDPIRNDVKDSIKECREAGIKVLMITGDHPLTAYAISKDLDLATSFDEIATTIDIEKYYNLGQEEFDNYIKTKKVFARVTPLDKLRIVESLKRMGEFVAVTGDGVNDAPAIKSANIGISMGSGTDVAKETASMIIIDDSFKSIVSGIKEGRTAYNNIRKISYMLLSCGLAEVLFFILSIIFDLEMPLVAIQLLWLNIVTDGLQDFSLSFEKSEKGIMKEIPRNTKESIFNKDLLCEVLISGLTIGLMVFGTWLYLMNSGMEIHLARGYIMVLMVFIQNIHVFNCRSEKHSSFKIPLMSNPLIIIVILSSILLQIIVMEVPMLSDFLQASTVPIIDMLKLLLLSSIIFIVMEIYKKIKYRHISK